MINLSAARAACSLSLSVLALVLAAAPVSAVEETPAEALERAMREQGEATLRSLELAPVARARRLAARQAPPSSQIACIPTCDENDGRFLAIAGADLATLTDPLARLEIAVPAGATSFTIGIFDGDGSEIEPASGESRWDLGPATLFEYTLLADPNVDGIGTTAVELEPGVTSVLSNTMPNDDWIDFTVATGPEAQAPSGNFFYVLSIERLAAAPRNLNAFKVRAAGVVTVESIAQPISYVVNFNGLEDLFTLYPEPDPAGGPFPDPTVSTYDGTFSFLFEVDDSPNELTIWGGDFDRGKFDLTEQDTDDPDTPGAPFLPPFGIPPAVPEGVAVGINGGTGNPPDDEDASGVGAFFVRAPSIRTRLVLPDGQELPNDNPSGNLEWEAFTLSTAPFDRNLMDVSLPVIPAGTYELRIEGVDLANLNSLSIPFRLLCVDLLGVACESLKPLLLSGVAFLDLDADGVRDADEPPLPGVVMLLSSGGRGLQTVVTAADGTYSFEVGPGSFTVEPAAENFDPGGPLAETFATTPESLDATVSDQNAVDLDFGFLGTGSIGDLVFFDQNTNGLPDDPAGGGLGGVRLELTGAGADGILGTADDLPIASAVTASDGSYSFAGLPPGRYRVEVDAGSLAADLELTTGNLPFDVTLGAGEAVTDADFGYGLAADGGGGLGDVVWRDDDRDGILDPGEPGLDGVTVNLSGDLDGDGVAELLLSTVTATESGQAGVYRFVNLPSADCSATVPCAYTVSIDPATLPAGIDEPSFDFDGVETPNSATLQLAAGETNNDVDFGYAGLGALAGRVWLDLDGDGTDDDGEPGIAGVTVSLQDATGAIVATVVTGVEGEYRFEGLTAGEYTVVVDATTLPDRLAPTFDFDGLDTPNRTTVVLGEGESKLDLDFGYGDCRPCSGKVTRLTLVFRGSSAARVKVIQKIGLYKVFDERVEPGEAFSFTGRDRKGTLGPEIKIFVNGRFHKKLHTSCSRPIGPGQVVGDFLVVAGASRNGGLLCPLEPGDPGGDCPDDDDDDGGNEDDDDGGNEDDDDDGGGNEDDDDDGGGHKDDDDDDGGHGKGPRHGGGEDDDDDGGQGEQGEDDDDDGQGGDDDDDGPCPDDDDDDDDGGEDDDDSGQGEDDDDDDGGQGEDDDDDGGGQGDDDDDDGGQDPGCGPCQGKVSELTLRYKGLLPAKVKVVQKQDRKVVFNGWVFPHATLTVNGADRKGTLGSEILIYLNGRRRATIHTSCSQPIGPGLRVRYFEVLSGASRQGGPLCPIGDQTSAELEVAFSWR